MYSVLYDTALLFASIEFSMLHPYDIILYVENCLLKDARNMLKWTHNRVSTFELVTILTCMILNE